MNISTALYLKSCIILHIFTAVFFMCSHNVMMMSGLEVCDFVSMCLFLRFYDSGMLRMDDRASLSSTPCDCQLVLPCERSTLVVRL